HQKGEIRPEFRWVHGYDVVHRTTSQAIQDEVPVAGGHELLDRLLQRPPIEIKNVEIEAAEVAEALGRWRMQVPGRGQAHAFGRRIALWNPREFVGNALRGANLAMKEADRIVGHVQT